MFGKLEDVLMPLAVKLGQKDIFLVIIGMDVSMSAKL